MTEQSLGRLSSTPVDVEAELVGFLRDTTGIGVSTTYPKDITPENVKPFIVLSTVSSTVRNVVVQTTIIHIDCFSSSTVEASRLAGIVSGLLTSWNRMRCRVRQAPMQVGRGIEMTASCFSLQVEAVVKAHPTTFIREEKITQ